MHAEIKMWETTSGWTYRVLWGSLNLYPLHRWTLHLQKSVEKIIEALKIFSGHLEKQDKNVITFQLKLNHFPKEKKKSSTNQYTTTFGLPLIVKPVWKWLHNLRLSVNVMIPDRCKIAFTQLPQRPAQFQPSVSKNYCDWFTSTMHGYLKVTKKVTLIGCHGSFWYFALEF